MDTRSINVIFIIICVLSIYLLPASANAANYERIHIPYGISVQIPRGWTTLSTNQLQQLENADAAVNEKRTSDLIFAALCYETERHEPPAATFRINLGRNVVGITQSSIARMSRADFEKLANQAKQGCVLGGARFGMEPEAGSFSSQEIRIGKYRAVCTAHIFEQPGNMRLCNLTALVPLPKLAVWIIATYDVNKPYFSAIINRILSSIRIDK